MCKEENCTKPVNSRGMCVAHYQKWRRSQPAQPIRSYNPVKGLTCKLCEKPAQARMLCGAHYRADQRAKEK